MAPTPWRVLYIHAAGEAAPRPSGGMLPAFCGEVPLEWRRAVSPASPVLQQEEFAAWVVDGRGAADAALALVRQVASGANHPPLVLLLPRGVDLEAAFRAGAHDALLPEEATAEMLAHALLRAVLRAGTGPFTSDTVIAETPVPERGSPVDRLPCVEDVLAAAETLLACPDADALLHQAVELARHRLGLERCAFFLCEPGGEFLVGVYGTDLSGRTTAERGQRFRATGHWTRCLEAPARGAPRWLVLEDQPRYEWFKDAARPVGRGWIAYTPIRSLSRVIGVLVNDAAITGGPWEKERQELAGVFCSLLGNILERKQAETALVQNETSFRSLIENVADAIGLLDADGTIRYASQSVERVLGYSPAELLGRSLFDLLHPEDRDAGRALIERLALQPGASVVAEMRALQKDGSPCLLESVGTNLLRDPAVGGLVLNSRDITERRRAEALLEGQRRVLERIAAGAALPEVLEEIARHVEALAPGARSCLMLLDREGRLRCGAAPSLPETYVRSLEGAGIGPEAGACGTAAYRREAVVSGDIASDPLWRGLGEAALAHGLRACWSVPVLSPGGSVLGTLAMYSGQPRDPEFHELPLLDGAARLAGIAIERARVDERLRLIESAVEHAGDAVVIAAVDTSPMHPEIVYANPAYCRLLGAGPDELVGRPFRIPASGGEPAAQELTRRVLERGQPDSGEAASQGGGGQARDLEWHAAPIRDGNGAIRNWACIQREVTERKRLEEQLRHSQKMEAVGRLAGGVAHDFNNLLGVIAGYAELLLEQAGPEDVTRIALLEMKKATDRAAALTRQLLTFSRKRAFHPCAVDLNEIVGNVDRLLRRLIGADVDLVTSLAAEHGWIHADPGQIEQVLMNLAVNARDAMPEGGHLRIETTDVRLPPGRLRSPAGLPPGEYVLLTVSDTGCGMGPDTQARIFEPFFTTKGPGQGTGLGLATVYAVIQKSGGQIEVVSEPERGTTFRIYLPRLERQPGLEPASEPAQPLSEGSETVLLAEDEPMLRELVRGVLQGRGYTVLAAADGEEALQLCREHAGPIHLLLTDVMMPGMNGVALAGEIAALRPEARVLYMSGYAEDAIIRRGVLKEGVQFLPKPFTPSGLARQVRAVLDEEARARTDHGWNVDAEPARPVLKAAREDETGCALE